MPNRYGDPDPVEDLDSRRRARDAAAAIESARQRHQRINESRAVHAPLDRNQANDIRQHRNTVNDQAEERRRAEARANCTLCDDAGYRGTTVCDHIDRTEIARRGSARVREALAAIKSRRETP